MGLLDVLNGMENGPRGAPNPAAPGSGMSKTTMALLGFLAYKAYKSFSSSHPVETTAPSRIPGAQETQPEGGLAGMLRTILGGGSLPGSVLSRGVGNTVQDLDHKGQGEIARSWVGRGDNKAIPPAKLAEALGEDAIADLMEQTGMEREELLAALSEHLPRVIDHLTPAGRVPTAEEAARMA